MTFEQRNREDEKMDQLLGNVLRGGVILSATVILIGGLIYIWRNGQETVALSVFKGEPTYLKLVPDLLSADVQARGHAIIQTGILLLLLTPITRVALSLLIFLRQRDFTYVLVTAIVLAVLLHSLLTV
ncbi:DUF1634 domain-containing protein [Thermosynechococcaceae cyanobacterium BACA0444]|uniref:DUF1634 domain-containing protein n=1 Tax=Pseudocalidococcus azoricus BACA0444 TaxID=2918990 RepID=A0AAE4JXX4_9CYAN|nr:DUF1634 domain-containing protein [Pseudocalidococcus azoricus]MDS3860354.1 DUF1634 domain-containing protein [Pseudocalidococcus azoricus BACA0444]